MINLPIRAWSCLALLAVGTAVSRAEEPAGPRTPEQDKASGYRLSNRLLQKMMKRWAYDLSDNIDLDAGQEAEVLSRLNERWIPFLQENQDKFAPLVERYLEAMVDPDPPDVAEVQQWSKTVLEMNDQILKMLDETDKDLSQLMRPEQLGRYRAESAKMRMGMGWWNGTLQQWAAGEFDTGRWDRKLKNRERRRERHRKAWEQKAARTPELKPFSPTAWEAYVIDFVTKFELDSAQTVSANAILDDVQARAHDYIQKKNAELERVRGEIVASPETGVRQKLIARERQLLDPLEKLFNELNDRLAEIPTKAQWRHAEEQNDSAQRQPTKDG